MGYISGMNRAQVLLFPEIVDDYMAENNPVRCIDAYVASLDLAALGFTHAVPKDTGRPAYAPAALLKLYISGYLDKLRSSRKLEQETHRNVEVRWLLGKLTPDFKTIADVRKDNAHALKHVCGEFTLLCQRLHLFGRELLAIDGSKFKAVNHKDRHVSEKNSSSYLSTFMKRLLCICKNWISKISLKHRPTIPQLRS
jgi:transposase